MLSCQSSAGSLTLRVSLEVFPLRYKDHGVGRIVDNVAARENRKTDERSCRILGRGLPLVKAVGGGSPTLFKLLWPLWPLWNPIRECYTWVIPSLLLRFLTRAGDERVGISGAEKRCFSQTWPRCSQMHVDASPLPQIDLCARNTPELLLNQFLVLRLM